MQATARGGGEPGRSPRRELVAALPRTQIGKIAKAALREQVAGGIDAPRKHPVPAN